MTIRIRRVPVFALSLLWAASALAPASARETIVGTWLVRHSNAPFPIHLYVFNADGTMQQANPDAGDERSSDSDGKGVWKTVGKHVRGKWVEIMADRATHKFSGTGEISFDLAIHCDSLEGSGSARFFDADGKLINGPFSTVMSGTRITVR